MGHSRTQLELAGTEVEPVLVVVVVVGLQGPVQVAWEAQALELLEVAWAFLAVAWAFQAPWVLGVLLVVQPQPLGRASGAP